MQYGGVAIHSAWILIEDLVLSVILPLYGSWPLNKLLNPLYFNSLICFLYTLVAMKSKSNEKCLEKCFVNCEIQHSMFVYLVKDYYYAEG